MRRDKKPTFPKEHRLFEKIPLVDEFRETRKLVSVFFYVPGFDFLRDGEISKDDRKDCETVAPGRGHETEEFPPGEKRDGEGGPDDEKRHPDQEAAGAAFEEWYFGGPDNINNESLGAQRFQEPTSMEKFLRRVENKKQDPEG